MKGGVLILALFLSGCATTVPGVKQSFPAAPAELLKRCEDLQKVETNSTVSITDLLKVVVNNYALYHECSTKVEGWNLWYREQKKIYDEVK